MVDLIHKRCRNIKGPKEQSPTLSSHDCVKSRTLKRSNQSILKEINPEYLLEGLMLKLKLQNFGHLSEEVTHLKRPWCWERLRAGGEGGDRGWDGWLPSLTQWTWVWANSKKHWRTRNPGVLQSMWWQRVRHNWTTKLQQGFSWGENLKSFPQQQKFVKKKKKKIRNHTF